ncbi:MAG: TonB family protein [Deltaproteobacteria bacterium]|nr:TonB family protein [Deltaproteobacteria bacterium]
MSVGAARWTGSDDRSPWRAFVAASVGVHAGAVALVALFALLAGPPDWSTTRSGRPRAVDLAYLALAEPPPPAAPRSPATGRPPATSEGSSGLESNLPTPSFEIVQPETSAAAATPAHRASGPTAGPGARAPAGMPARTLVVVSAWDGELAQAGVVDGTVQPSGVAGDGVANAEPGHPTMTVGPAESPMTVSFDTGDSRYSGYFGMIAPLLERELRDAFPRERALLMQQGEIVFEWTIGADGSISEPKVVRPSGVSPFDRNVLDGFRRAARRFPRPPPTMPLPVRILHQHRYDNPMFD